MKNLIVLAALITCTLTFGQERHHEKKDQHRKRNLKQLEDLSSEQIATLKTKKMTMDLDLSKSQQSKIYTLQLNMVKARKEKQIIINKNNGVLKQELSPEEKFNRMNSRLDRKIAFKNKMKSILSDEQFTKWKHMQHHVSSRKRKHHKKSR